MMARFVTVRREVARSERVAGGGDSNELWKNRRGWKLEVGGWCIESGAGWTRVRKERMHIERGGSRGGSRPCVTEARRKTKKQQIPHRRSRQSVAPAYRGQRDRVQDDTKRKSLLRLAR